MTTPAPPFADDSAHWDLDRIVQELRHSREVAHNIRHLGRVRELPSRVILERVAERLAAALFPTHYGEPDQNGESIDYFVGTTLHTALRDLREQVRRGLRFNMADRDRSTAELLAMAEDTTRQFAAALPDIRALLVHDIQAAYQGDPAAGSVAEILLAYPGIKAIIYHRLAHTLYRLGSPFLARLMAEIAHSLTGIDIHPGAQIDESFFIDHGTGVVIGETAIIGKRVRIYQAVTLGARRFPADENGVLVKGGARHPVVEDDVVIYAGATLLGRITIGKGSVIGGNVWLTRSVPPASNISQAHMRSDMNDPADRNASGPI